MVSHTNLVPEDSRDVQRRSAVGVDDVGRSSVEVEEEFDQERTAGPRGHVERCPASVVGLKRKRSKSFNTFVLTYFGINYTFSYYCVCT